MPLGGRGRGMTVGQGEELRRPGPARPHCSILIARVRLRARNQRLQKKDQIIYNGVDIIKAKSIMETIMKIQSPDDLQVQELASEIKNNITEEEELKWFVEELCTKGLDERSCAPVAAKMFGLIAQHHVGECKIRNLLLRRVQREYAKKDELAASNWDHLVTSALFLGEIFHHVKSEQNTPFKVLAIPVLKYLEMIIEPNLTESKKTIDEDMIVVSKQLLQNGGVLHEVVPEGVLELVQRVTKILCLCQLNTASRLNLLAALAEMWPILNATNSSIRSQHALLASSIGVSLYI